MLIRDLESIKFDLLKFTLRSSSMVVDHNATAVEFDSIVVHNFKTDFFTKNFTKVASTPEHT